MERKISQFREGRRMRGRPRVYQQSILLRSCSCDMTEHITGAKTTYPSSEKLGCPPRQAAWAPPWMWLSQQHCQLLLMCLRLLHCRQQTFQTLIYWGGIAPKNFPNHRETSQRGSLPSPAESAPAPFAHFTSCSLLGV